MIVGDVVIGAIVPKNRGWLKVIGRNAGNRVSGNYYGVNEDLQRDCRSFPLILINEHLRENWDTDELLASEFTS